MRVIISAGGTGGHIYPALAIINKIKEEEPDSEILYIGTTDRMEKDLIPSLGYKYEALEVKGLKRKLTLDNIKTVTCFISAIKRAKEIIKDFDPDIVIGCGGYVTAPVIYAAKICKVKTIIHEQNSVLGVTNRFLSKYVDAVLVSFPDTVVKAKRVVYTGNPSSEELNIPFSKSELGLSSTKKLVLIVMGSLGSKVINDRMKEILPKFSNKDYEILFITGKDYYDEFSSLKLGKNIKVFDYIDNMKKVFKKVDVMVSRAGATTLSEIISYKVATVLVPSPYVTDNHQYKNAMSLVNKNAALLLEEKDLNYEILSKDIEELLNNKEKVKCIKDNLSKMKVVDSASKIYDLIQEVIR